MKTPLVFNLNVTQYLGYAFEKVVKGDYLGIMAKNLHVFQCLCMTFQSYPVYSFTMSTLWQHQMRLIPDYVLRQAIQEVCGLWTLAATR